MDEDKIIEVMAQAMSGFDQPGGSRWKDIAEISWDAAKAALAEAGTVIVPRGAIQNIIAIRDWNHEEDHDARRDYDGAADRLRELISAPDQRR